MVADKPLTCSNHKELSGLITPNNSNVPSRQISQIDIEEGSAPKERPTWSRGLDFLMSCLSLSVGLGNIWRFPYTCYLNGGAIFVIPYLIILFLVGKPFYLLEMCLGQFTSKGSMKAIEILPIMKGIGWGQQIASATIATYYTSIVGLCLTYLIKSFAPELPWATCGNFTKPCYPAESRNPMENVDDNQQTSSQIYLDDVIKQTKTNLADGIGAFVPHLVLTLLISWICIYVSIIKGIKTSGKIAYFFAIFPYIVLISIMIFAFTLDGAWTGISYFINPGDSFRKLFDPMVWYNACTQCFYSLTIGMGSIIMFSSYNNFNHNIYRDAAIISLMDTATSMLGGITIFAILGNLSSNLNGKKIEELIKSPSGLAFITYPEVIAKIKTSFEDAWYLPQILSITFFAMLFVLGIGSTVGLMNNISTNLKDYFPKVKYWQFAGVCSIGGFLIGLVYCTEGGSFIVDLVDHFGGQFLLFALSTMNLVCIVWIYGLQNICWDIEFMLSRKLSAYWRICWAVIMPGFMLAICVYLAITMESPKYGNNQDYPTLILASGWTLFVIGCSQVFICCVYLYYQRKEKNFKSFLANILELNPNWGPSNNETKLNWIKFKEQKKKQHDTDIIRHNLGWIETKWWELTGKFE